MEKIHLTEEKKTAGDHVLPLILVFSKLGQIYLVDFESSLVSRGCSRPAKPISWDYQNTQTKIITTIKAVSE